MQLLYLTKPHSFGAAVRTNVIIVTLRFAELNLFRNVCLTFTRRCDFGALILCKNCRQQNIALRYAIISSRKSKFFGNNQLALARYNNYAACRGTKLSRARHSAPGCCVVRRALAFYLLAIFHNGAFQNYDGYFF